jgi:hypothetical protein
MPGLPISTWPARRRCTRRRIVRRDGIVRPARGERDGCEHNDCARAKKREEDRSFEHPVSSAIRQDDSPLENGGPSLETQSEVERRNYCETFTKEKKCRVKTFYGK